MRETLHSKLAFRVAQIKGGAQGLAQYLGVPIDTVHAWMRAEKSIPDELLFRLFDVFTDELLAEVSQPPRIQSKDANANAGSPSTKDTSR